MCYHKSQKYDMDVLARVIYSYNEGGFTANLSHNQ